MLSNTDSAGSGSRYERCHLANSASEKRYTTGPAKRDQNAARGIYQIISLLPQREDGEFEYRIRNLDEQHELVAQESELKGRGSHP
jgi:hypothetical protein